MEADAQTDKRWLKKTKTKLRGSIFMALNSYTIGIRIVRLRILITPIKSLAPAQENQEKESEEIEAKS